MRYLYTTLGFISLGLAALGLFLPLLPTTPFLLLSAALFAKSSDKWYNWLLNHPKFGAYIRDFREEQAISLRLKIISVSTLWITILSSAYFALAGKLWLQILLICIALGVTYHILSFKTKK